MAGGYLAGSALWLVGLAFEAVGDAQLAAYKEIPKAQRPQVLDTGLWRWTRHPNYFGDAAVTWGLWLVGGLGSGWAVGLATVVAPIAMTYFLVFATGARLLEQTMMQRPGYPQTPPAPRCSSPCRPSGPPRPDGTGSLGPPLERSAARGRSRRRADHRRVRRCPAAHCGSAGSRSAGQASPSRGRDGWSPPSPAPRRSWPARARPARPGHRRHHCRRRLLRGAALRPPPA